MHAAKNLQCSIKRVLAHSSVFQLFNAVFTYKLSPSVTGKGAERGGEQRDATVSLSSNPSILGAFVAGHLMGGSV